MSTNNSGKINISSILKILRGYKKITITKLAEEMQQIRGTTEKYEFDNRVPPIDILIKMAAYFQVSIDFLLLSSKTKFIRNVNFLSISEKIDKLESEKKCKVESTIEAFLKSLDKSSFDTTNLELTNNIHENIKILRKNMGVSQRVIADYLGINKTAVSHYENNQNPSPENLIKLSNYFNVSVHFLITGEKLFYHFYNESFKLTALKADKQLSLEQQKFIIEFMEALINNN